MIMYPHQTVSCEECTITLHMEMNFVKEGDSFRVCFLVVKGLPASISSPTYSHCHDRWHKGRYYLKWRSFWESNINIFDEHPVWSVPNPWAASIHKHSFYEFSSISVPPWMSNTSHGRKRVVSTSCILQWSFSTTGPSAGEMTPVLNLPLGWTGPRLRGLSHLSVGASPSP